MAAETKSTASSFRARVPAGRGPGLFGRLPPIIMQPDSLTIGLPMDQDHVAFFCCNASPGLLRPESRSLSANVFVSSLRSAAQVGRRTQSHVWVLRSGSWAFRLLKPYQEVDCGKIYVDRKVLARPIDWRYTVSISRFVSTTFQGSFR
jgi:hypothetical protein